MLLGVPKFRPLGWAVILTVWIAGTAPVQAQPANDKFSNAQTISGLVGTVTSTTVGAGFQVNEPAHAGYDAAHSIWFRWTAPSTPVRAYFTTEQSDFNTILAIYTGKNLDSLAAVASNDDATPDTRYSRTQFQARAGETYWIAIDGVSEDVGNAVLSWITNPFNDNFVNFRMLSEPQGSFAGNSTGATLENQEDPPLAGDVTNTVWFAWAPNDSGEVTFDTIGSDFNTILAIYKGNELDDLTLIVSDDDSGGEDGTSKITFEARAGDRYRLVIGGREGASGAYEVHWTQQVPPPVNDHFSSWQELKGFAGQAYGANFGATEEPEEPLHGSESSHASVWYSWEADRSGRVCLLLEEISAALLLAVYEGEEVAELAAVANGESGPGVPPVPACFEAVQGRRYRFAVDGKNGATGSFRLQWTYDDLKSPYNLFANAKVLSGFNCGTITENYYADLQPGEPLHAGDSGGKSVWFQWKALASYKVRLDTDGSNFDTLLAVYTGKDPETGLVLIKSDDDSDGRTTSQLTFDAAEGETYYFAVDGSTLQDTEPPGFGVVVLTLTQAMPQLVLFSPARSTIGSQVRIGTLNFPGLVSVAIGSRECEFIVDSEGILATVPDGATTGIITLTNEEGGVRSSQEELVVLPSIPPSLTIQQVGADMIEVAWPSQHTEFKLEWNTAIDAEAGWVEVSSPPVLIGDMWVALRPVDRSQTTTYFRLMRP